MGAVTVILTCFCLHYNANVMLTFFLFTQQCQRNADLFLFTQQCQRNAYFFLFQEKQRMRCFSLTLYDIPFSFNDASDTQL